MHPAVRVTIAVLTHNRREQVVQTLKALGAVAGKEPIVVVDNGSTDGTPEAIAQDFPAITLIKLGRNMGAAARNVAVAHVSTPYVAFCDDDTQWEPQALQHAARILDLAPTIAVLSGCVLVGEERLLDPTCVAMEQSPLPQGRLPGPQLLGFMAGACVMRVQAYREVGGYWPALFIGGEEELMALDLVEKGWHIVYAKEVITRHFPSKLRNASLRQKLLLRNAIWVAWMRRPWHVVPRHTILHLRRARHQGILWAVTAMTIAGMPRAIANRKEVSSEVERMKTLLDSADVPGAS